MAQWTVLYVVVLNTRKASGLMGLVTLKNGLWLEEYVFAFWSIQASKQNGAFFYSEQAFVMLKFYAFSTVIELLFLKKYSISSSFKSFILRITKVL